MGSLIQDSIPGHQPLSHQSLFVIFWGNYILFSMVAAPVYIHTDSAQGRIPFSPYPCQYLLFLVFFDTSHSDWCKMMIPHCDFNLHFPDGEWCWASFSVPVGHLYVFFGKMSIQILCSFFLRFYFLFIIDRHIDGQQVH